MFVVDFYDVIYAFYFNILTVLRSFFVCFVSHW